jgi:hypothetical protein
MRSLIHQTLYIEIQVKKAEGRRQDAQGSNVDASTTESLNSPKRVRKNLLEDGNVTELT